MPIFNYECGACQERFEYILNSSDPNPELLPCPQCKQVNTVKKSLSFFGSYKIKGDNSASETPKKFRGGGGRPQ